VTTIVSGNVVPTTRPNVGTGVGPSGRTRSRGKTHDLRRLSSAKRCDDWRRLREGGLGEPSEPTAQRLQSYMPLWRPRPSKGDESDGPDRMVAVRSIQRRQGISLLVLARAEPYDRAG
jgi:hypothetical protein